MSPKWRVERDAARPRSGTREGEGNGQHGIGSQPRLIGRAVERDEGAVELLLGVEIPAGEGGVDLPADIGDGAAAAQSAVALRVAVAQLVRLGAAGGGPGGHRGRRGYAPPASSQRAQTVGRPRLSRISLALRRSIRGMVRGSP